MREKVLNPIKFELDEYAMRKLEKFKENHGIGKCSAFRDSFGACFTFSFTPCGLGNNEIVKCSCGAEEILCDFDNI